MLRLKQNIKRMGGGLYNGSHTDQCLEKGIMRNLKEYTALLIKSIRLFSWPVGSIYTSTKPTDPHELFGGTWEPIQDTFLWCAGPKHAAGTTGGEETHKLIIEEMPSHSHQYNRLPQLFINTDLSKEEQANFNSSVRASSNTEYTQTWNTGGSQPHNNMPPYKSVYAWQRVK